MLPRRCDFSRTNFHESLRLSSARQSPDSGHCTCDDVLYQLDDGTYAQVHLTFTKKPFESRDWPGHDAFETIADWMIAVMVPNHIDHFDL